VAQHVGQLEIVGSPVGSEVVVDGEPVGKLPLDGTIAVTAGVVAIEVRAQGHVSVVRSSQIKVGGLARESFDLQLAAPAGAAAATGAPLIRHDGASSARLSNGAENDGARLHGDGRPLEAIPRDDQPRPAEDGAQAGGMPRGRIVALVAAGLSAGALALGVYEHVKWQDRVSAFQHDMACDLGALSTACQSVYDEGHSARTLAFVGYGAAAAFATTAVVLWLLSSESPAESKTVACSAGPGSFGLACGARF
jgi:hypothetical protein